MKCGSRHSISPGAAIALLALFFALGGSAFAVGERSQSATVAQQRCAQGAIRGIAHVTGGPNGAANIPDRFTGSNVLFARKFNCTRRAIQVRRLGIGIYELQFVGNGAPSAIGSGVSGAQSSADRIGPGLFRITVSPTGRADPADLPFMVTLV
ncbi:MAG: hypothetical protein ACRDNY_05475 [Gaiellaceae bacterium]